MQKSHVWYQNDMLNETKWFKAFLALQVTVSDLQMTSEVTCDLIDDPQIFAMQNSHVWYQIDRLNETKWFKVFLALQMTTSDLRGQWPQKLPLSISYSNKPFF